MTYVVPMSSASSTAVSFYSSYHHCKGILKSSVLHLCNKAEVWYLLHILQLDICFAWCTGSNQLSQGTPPAGPTSYGDRSQGRPPQQADPRPTSPVHLTPTPSSSSGDVNDLRQLVAGLQSQNSQLIQLTKQQQSTIVQLEVGMST